MNAGVLLVAAISGALFGAGLVISDMASSARVLGFLRVGAGWDATLGWVMASALAVSLPGFAWARRRPKPLFGTQFLAPASRSLDLRLLLGAALFGLGWGLSGFCPGPALVNAGLWKIDGLWFVAAMLAGGLAADIKIRSRLV